jgi:DNA-binding transcriptional MerR regulator
MRREGEYTLSQAARLLGEPQHRLIYLCEKGVVQPDLQDAEGRGSSRRFSGRNLLEFAVALRLRELEIPASLVGAVIYVLRAFERSVRKRLTGFHLPESLRDPQAPDLRVVIGNGQRLYFTLGTGGSPAKVYGDLDPRQLDASRKSSRALERELARPKPSARSGTSQQFGGPEGSRHARVEVSITRIARDLRLQS